MDSNCIMSFSAASNLSTSSVNNKDDSVLDWDIFCGM